MTSFLDTNVLLYADDLDAGAKTGVARDLIRGCLRSGTGAVSTQVLAEYFVNARTKLGIEGGAARARVELYGALLLVRIDLTILLSAVDLHRLDAISLWDALIVRAAQHARCHRLYTEDLQHGRRYGTLEVVNPFA